MHRAHRLLSDSTLILCSTSDRRDGAHVPLASDEPGIGLDVEHGFNDIGKSEGRGRRTALRRRKRRQERDKKLGEILFFDGAVDLSQVIAKCVTGVGCSFLEVTGEVQLCTQCAPSLNCFCLLPLPLPNVPGGCK